MQFVLVHHVKGIVKGAKSDEWYFVFKRGRGLIN